MLGRADRRRELYEALVTRHGGEIYHCAYRLCGHPETAEDLCQETFYEAWRSLAALREVEKARAWLFQILRHRYAHWVRDCRRQPQLAAFPDDPESAPGSVEAAFVEQIERQHLLQGAIDTLADRYKVPLLMVLLEGRSCREAAAELGVPLGTVLSRIHRARLVLRKYLRRAEPNDAGAGRALPFEVADLGTRRRR